MGAALLKSVGPKIKAVSPKRNVLRDSTRSSVTSRGEVSDIADDFVVFEEGRTRGKVVILGETFDELGAPVAPYPSGDDSLDRGTIFHYVDRMLFGSLFSAPVKQLLQAGAKVLDVGSGGSQWLIAVASEYPNSIFYGIDLNPQLHVKPIPSNLRLMQGNILEGIPFDDNMFDFVHLRSMALSFQTVDWLEKIVPEAIRVTKINGWLEMCELDNRYYHSVHGPLVAAVNELFHTELLAREVDGSIILQMPQTLRDTREFINVQHLSAVAPFTPSHGRITILNKEALRMEWINAEQILNMRMDINDHDAYMAIADEFTQELQDLDAKTKCHRVHGQKVLI